MSDFLLLKHREVVARIETLRPAAEEYERLLRVAAFLAEETGSAPAPRKRRATRKRAPRGANQAAILAAVARKPGITPVEISTTTQIAAPTVHATVYKLKRTGRLVAQGSGVAIASSEPARPAARRSEARRRRARGARAAANGSKTPRAARAAARRGSTADGAGSRDRATAGPPTAPAS